MHAVAMSASLVGWLVCAQFASVGYYWTFYYLFALIVAGRELTTDRIVAAHAATAARRRQAREQEPLRHDPRTRAVEGGRRGARHGCRADAPRRTSRRVLIDSRTAMNYVMAAPIQAALADDPRVRFYATSSDRRTTLPAIYPRRLPGHGADLAGARSARSVSTPT